MELVNTLCWLREYADGLNVHWGEHPPTPAPLAAPQGADQSVGATPPD